MNVPNRGIAKKLKSLYDDYINNKKSSLNAPSKIGRLINNIKLVWGVAGSISIILSFISGGIFALLINVFGAAIQIWEAIIITFPFAISTAIFTVIFYYRKKFNDPRAVLIISSYLTAILIGMSLISYQLGLQEPLGMDTSWKETGFYSRDLCIELLSSKDYLDAKKDGFILSILRAANDSNLFHFPLYSTNTMKVNHEETCSIDGEITRDGERMIPPKNLFIEILQDLFIISWFIEAFFKLYGVISCLGAITVGVFLGWASVLLFNNKEKVNFLC